jgi:hypothetical protein
VSLLQLHAAAGPLAGPEVAATAARLLARLEAIGLLTATAEPVRVLDTRTLAAALRPLADRGVARDAVRVLRSRRPPAGAGYAALLRRVEAELADSPLPDLEWRALAARLGADLLGDLVGVSPASVRRYTAGSRSTPDDVAVRLHALALTVADLLGSYNDYGVRRWWRRPRPQLAGRSPADLLAGDWRPDDPGPRQVAQLARALTVPAAT